jgi:hypothetical protein
VARAAAQRTLIESYLAIDQAVRRDGRLGRVVGGYRQWRGRLSGRSVVNAGLDPEMALVDAYVDVVLNGERASEPAKALHKLLAGTVPHEVDAH